MYVADDTDAPVARTKTIVGPAELMADFDAAGKLIALEVLDPTLLERVPEVLWAHGVEAPEGVQFDLLSRAFAAA